MSKKYKFVICSYFLLFLIGCDSGINGQIEKCVQAKMKASEEYERTKGMWDIKTSPAQNEADARTGCLRAASGQK